MALLASQRCSQALPAAYPAASRPCRLPSCSPAPRPPPSSHCCAPRDGPRPRGCRAVYAAAARRAAGAAPPPAPGAPGGTPAPPGTPGHGLVATLPFSEDTYVEVGRVTGAHGVRGELRLEASTDEPAKRFKAGKRLFLRPPPAQGVAAAAAAGAAALTLIPVTSRGAKVRPLGKGLDAWLVALDEVKGRTQAEQLHSYTVYCCVADRDALRDPDEFYVQELVGCTVLEQASRRLVGSVVDVYSGMGTHDVLRVKLRASEQDILNSRIRYCLIPFVKAICPVLDRTARILEVAPPEGLLDLTTATPLRKPLSEEAKKEKLQELQDIRRREEEARQAQPAGGAAAVGAAAPEAAQPSSSAAARRPRGPRSQPRQQKSTSADEDGDAAPADGDADEGDDEGGDEALEGEGAAAEAAPARARRPGLRRQAGSTAMRLGRRRVAGDKGGAGDKGEAK